MKVGLKGLSAIAIGLVLSLAVGCATKQTMPRSGFLTDYSGLTQEDPMGYADWTYINDKANFRAYDKIMIDHVVFFLKEDAEYKGFDADETKELADVFHKAIVDALADAYVITDETGPEVMRLRLAVTDLVPGKPVIGTMTTIIPVGLAVDLIKKGAGGEHIGTGEVSVEVELLDSQTGERLGAAIDHKAGAKYKVHKTVTKWGHAKDMFNQWAKNLRKRLDKLSGRK